MPYSIDGDSATCKVEDGTGGNLSPPAFLVQILCWYGNRDSLHVTAGGRHEPNQTKLGLKEPDDSVLLIPTRLPRLTLAKVKALF
jgi:hypothetical protein